MSLPSVQLPPDFGAITTRLVELPLDFGVVTPRFWFSYPQILVQLLPDVGAVTPRFWGSYQQILVRLPPDFGAVTPRLWCSYPQTLVTRTQGCVSGLSLPRTTTHLWGVDHKISHKSHQGVHGNQEGQSVEGGTVLGQVIEDSADEKRNKAHLENKT